MWDWKDTSHRTRLTEKCNETQCRQHGRSRLWCKNVIPVLWSSIKSFFAYARVETHNSDVLNVRAARPWGTPTSVCSSSSPLPPGWRWTAWSPPWPASTPPPGPAPDSASTTGSRGAGPSCSAGYIMLLYYVMYIVYIVYCYVMYIVMSSGMQGGLHRSRRIPHTCQWGQGTPR